MNIETLKEIIVDQEKEIDLIIKEQKIIKRDVTEPYSKFIKKDIIIVITGVRRCGKSVLCHQLLNNKKHRYINFDDERLKGLKADELNNVLKAFYELYGDASVILLDEVQNVDGWEMFVNRLNRMGIEVIVTGSNSMLLSSEMATHITGRYIPLILFPFSFREFLKYEKIEILKTDFYDSKKASLIKKKLEEYIQIGGFPQVVQNKEISKEYLSSLYDSILLKDIVLRHKVRFSNQLRDISNYLLSNPGEIVSYNRLTNLFEIKNIRTVKQYVSYLEEAYLVCMLNKFSFKQQEIIRARKKAYPIDVGLSNIVSVISRENKWKKIECIVALDLLRRKDGELFYWQDQQGNEVDFIVKKGNDIKELIQVCYDIENEHTKNRESRSLLKGSKELKCSNLSVITWDFESKEEIEEKKITFIPLWKWLLKVNNDSATNDENSLI